ncbi:unnamed protein product [Cylindrotheca closterium]|uniref:VWFD domain-containing protein n=1 Tax=Cylindrotheca closterium TaxID=2856 RepID=A0AAD2FMK2_9STRA|nr:unnamed protein product [Cylindrotheca closterium]
MRYLLALLLVLSSVSAQTWPRWVSTRYKYNPTSGDSKCALVNVVVDESGSMETEQAFLRETALPKIAESLYTIYGYDHVFLSSNGFGARNLANVKTDPMYFRHLGASRFKQTAPFAPENPQLLEWVNNGSREDGYHALRSAMYWVPLVISGYNMHEECATIDRNLILVTDEDRDSENIGVTMDEVQRWMADRDYILNIVIPINILGELNNLGAKVTSSGSELFIADGSGGWTTELSEAPFNEIAANNPEEGTSNPAHTAYEHYVPLITDTAGAVWCVDSLRRGIRDEDENLALSFANAFVNVKAEEIFCLSTNCNPTSGPTTAPTSGPTGAPTTSPPSTSPSRSPTPAPSDSPTTSPSPAPTSSPTTSPSSTPTKSPVVTTYSPAPTSSAAPTTSPVAFPDFPDIGSLEATDAGSKGDPHFTTWQGEHFEFHGQCDLTLAKDADFADGTGLNVQIRTKLVRYWSYIKSAAIFIGGDILEVQGSGDMDREVSNYWVNFEFQGKTNSIGGFPLTLYDDKFPGHPKRRFEIDLSSKYPGQKIVISTFKEFVKVDFANPSADAFGNTVGMLGNFKSGKTLSRDQATVIHDFTEFGTEWQVLPSDDMLFHDLSQPQFPEPCVLPEDPRGDRRRRLDESKISLEQAEQACATLNDPLSIKDCVYDILATQDLDMVGAF